MCKLLTPDANEAALEDRVCHFQGSDKLFAQDFVAEKPETSSWRFKKSVIDFVLMDRDRFCGNQK